MKKFFDKTIYKKWVLVIPLIIMVFVFILTNMLFERDKQQTYERVKNLKETQVQVLTAQIDHVVSLYNEEELSEQEVDIMTTAVGELNKMEGVYCYLYAEDEMISGMTGTDTDNYIGNQLIQNIESKDFKALKINGTYRIFYNILSVYK